MRVGRSQQSTRPVQSGASKRAEWGEQEGEPKVRGSTKGEPKVRGPTKGEREGGQQANSLEYKAAGLSTYNPPHRSTSLQLLLSASDSIVDYKLHGTATPKCGFTIPASTYILDPRPERMEAGRSRPNQ